MQTYETILKELLSENTFIYQSHIGSDYKILNIKTNKLIDIDLGTKGLKFDNQNYNSLNNIFKSLPNNKNINLKTWLTDRKIRVATFEFHPWNNKKILVLSDKTIINTWDDPQEKYNLEEIPKELPQIYKYFFEMMIPDNPSKEWVLDWLSATLNQKVLTFLCLIGNEGIGKNTLSKILRLLHLDHQAAEIDNATFAKDWNDYMMCKTFVCFDEITLKNKDDDSKLKSLVNDRINIRKKYAHTNTESFNSANIMIISNYDDAIRVTNNSRRYGIVDLTEEKMVNWKIPTELGNNLSEFHKNLYDLENIKKLYMYLKNKDINSDLESVFEGLKKREMVESNIPNWCYKIVDKIKNIKGKIHINNKLLEEIFGEYDKQRPKIYTVRKNFKEFFSHSFKVTSDKENNIYLEKISEETNNKSAMEGMII